MSKLLPIEGIHHGHRARMRAKLVTHGARTFDTYELLEMLLYHVVKYKDTNPIAKQLLSMFGGIDGVFNASREELMRVPGIGESAADFLVSVARIAKIGAHTPAEEDTCFDDYHVLGEFLVERFSELDSSEVMMLLFDNSMRLISYKRLYDGDYSSAVVRSSAFIDYALSSRAAVAVVAHNHPFGPLYPTTGDMATNRMVADALRDAGVCLLEHYVISGNSYVGAMKHLKSAFSQSVELERFIRSKGV